MSTDDELGADQDREDDAVRAAPGAGPRVSVLIPAYRSHETVAGTLEALSRQEFPGSFEIVVVDSSPDSRTEEVVRAFPEVRFQRSQRRLLPHAARNEAARLAKGELLVFTDPDVYPRTDWLATLVAAHRETSHVVVGSLDCHGDRWLDLGIHLCKFSKWLPGGEPRPLDMSPTANMLIPRGLFTDVGGFDGELMLGDALLSWNLTRRKEVLWFEPRAVVDHHHTSAFREFLEERFHRGYLFGQLRSRWSGHGRLRDFWFLVVSVLPIRLGRILGLVLRDSRRAGWTERLASTLPIVVSGHVASLLGEARAYFRSLRA